MTFRSPLSLALATFVLAAGPLSVPSSAQAAAPAAEQLYDEGRKAYRLGDFQTAVEKWEQAYDVSDNGLLLYNISLAYKGLYTITGDLADLRRSRAVLDNFIKVARVDPDIDTDDAPQRLAELDTMIAEAEKAQEPDEPPPPTVVTPPEDDELLDERGPDPGKKLRLAGIGTMAGGGALVMTGIGLLTFYALKGREFKDDLKRDSDAYDDSGCADMPEDSACQQLENNIDTWRENGKQSNLLAVALGAGLGGLGAVALVAGGLVFNEGNKRTKQWERGLTQLRFMPTPRGFTISGRF